MPDIKRERDPNRYTEPHLHTCPNCKRSHMCNCQAQPNQAELVCRDCETATYDPAVHGGTGEKPEA
jgi:transcription elongation factor Elf1